MFGGLHFENKVRDLGKADLERRDRKLVDEVKADLVELRSGLKHEIYMCKLTERFGYDFIRDFEANDHLPDDVRKRAEEAKKQKRLTEKDRKLRMETKTAKADTTVSKPGFKPPFKHRPTNTNADKPCFNCNMKGHWARDCPLPHRKEK